MDSKSPDRFVLQVNRICKKDDRWSEKLRRAMSDGIHATILEQIARGKFRMICRLHRFHSWNRY
ncbi:hypothetical protein D918_06003 [Trichuris suis]|nr:hypothetical protein D918_06003 [Trichuris suis]